MRKLKKYNLICLIRKCLDFIWDAYNKQKMCLYLNDKGGKIRVNYFYFLVCTKLPECVTTWPVPGGHCYGWHTHRLLKCYRNISISLILTLILHKKLFYFTFKFWISGARCKNVTARSGFLYGQSLLCQWFNDLDRDNAITGGRSIRLCSIFCIMW